MKNPDGSYVYRFYGIFNCSYAVANGRHIVLDMGKNKNNRRRTDFSNT